MSAEPVACLVERKKPSSDWTKANGIYADLSDWPKEVRYYAKCPKCSDVHGSYATMKEAHAQRLCHPCNLDAIEKIKKQVQQVISTPEKKVRTLASIVRESAEFLPPEGDPPADIDVPTDDALFGVDAASEMDRLLHSDWPTVTLRLLAYAEECAVEDLTINDDYGDYDADDPDSATCISVNGYKSWIIYKDESEAYDSAIELVEYDLKSEPENYNASWLSSFIDSDDLAHAIGDPYDDWGDDERAMDYDEKLQKMVDEDEIEFDDPSFFDGDGDPLPEDSDRSAQLDKILDDWIDNSKPKFDPWEYLEDNYGKDNAVKEALRLVPLRGDSLERAAKEAVGSDGWDHFIAPEGYTELDNGSIVVEH